MSDPTLIRTYVRAVEVEGNNVFVREAGDPSNTTILMLHGFPGSSFQYRDFIPLLADKYHVIAPDMLGFGFSDDGCAGARRLRVQLRQHRADHGAAHPGHGGRALCPSRL